MSNNPHRQTSRRPAGPAAPRARAALLWAGVACLWGLALPVGCERAQPPPAAPAPTVTVSRPLVREVIEWDEYTGHLEAPETVNVAARVSGLLVQAPFQEGTIVTKGQVLFVIDPDPFKADLQSKQADVSKAGAQAALTAAQFRRYEELRQARSVSEQDYDNVKAAHEQAEAVLAGAKAAAEIARLNLEWTRVTAPITGRVGRKNVTEGNLVNGGAGQATLLTTIESVDPIYCYVDAAEAAVLKYQRLAREKKRASAREVRVPAFMALGDESSFPHEGYIDFVDNKVDPGTGTILARAVFANADAYLVPGFFGRVRIPGSGRYTALLVPDLAIGTDQNLKYLLIAGADGTVERRPVKLGALFGKLRAIEDGVAADDRVIVDGLLRARPGMKVLATERPIPDDALNRTAPGSPTTRELPATRDGREVPGPGEGPATRVTTMAGERPPAAPPQTAPGGTSP